MDLPTVIYGVAIATNAVFTNIAPTFYREINHWDLPIQCPLKAEELKRFAYQVSQGGYSLELKRGWFLNLDSGVLTSFESPAFRNHKLRPKPGDKARVSLKQALAIATNLVARLGLPDNVTWVRLNPEIEKPKMPAIPWYDFTWYEPQEEDSYTVRVAVDCRDGSVISAHFGCLYGQLVAKLPATPRPNEEIPPTAVTNEPPPPDILREQLHRMVADLCAWAPKLGIPGTCLSEDWIRQNLDIWLKLTKRDKSPRWVCTIRSKEGWQFGFREGKLRMWGTPEVFFRSDDTPPDLTRMTGKWRMSEKQGADLARKTVRELGFGGEVPQVLARPPEVQKPNLRPPPTVPRYLFLWQQTKPTGRGGFRYISARISAEVDADRQRVLSLSVYLWEEGDDQILVR